MKVINKKIRLEVYRVLYELYNKEFESSIKYYDTILFNSDSFCDNIHDILANYCHKNFNKYAVKEGYRLNLLPELSQFRPKNENDVGYWFKGISKKDAYSKRRAIINKVIKKLEK